MTTLFRPGTPQSIEIEDFVANIEKVLTRQFADSCL